VALGRLGEAREWFLRAASADVDGRTDAGERVDELDGTQFVELDEAEDADRGDPAAHEALPESEQEARSHHG